MKTVLASCSVPPFQLPLLFLSDSTSSVKKLGPPCFFLCFCPTGWSHSRNLRGGKLRRVSSDLDRSERSNALVCRRNVPVCLFSCGSLIVKRLLIKIIIITIIIIIIIRLLMCIPIIVSIRKSVFHLHTPAREHELSMVLSSSSRKLSCRRRLSVLLSVSVKLSHLSGLLLHFRSRRYSAANSSALPFI